MLEDSNFTYTYDDNGNLTSKTSKASGEVTTYTYDPENQLVRVDRPGTVAEYRYDALGRRIEKVVNGVSTRYAYDNEDIAAELDGANTIQALYIHGPGIDEPLLLFREGRVVVPHADGLGSITTLTDLNGNPVRSYTYDSFGRIVAQTGTITNPYTYTGRELDPETGLYYYRARYYDPTIGRFLQEDPFLGLRSIPLSLNRYIYVLDNPVRFRDSSGQSPDINAVSTLIRKGANLILSAEIGKAVAGVLGDTSGRVLLVGSAAADLAGALQILNAARVIASAGLAIGEASAVYASIIGLSFTGGFVVGTLINDFLIPCNTKIIIGDTILETLNNGPKNVADFYGRSLKTLIRPPSEPLWLDEASGFP